MGGKKGLAKDMPYGGQDWYKQRRGPQDITDAQLECINWLLDPERSGTQADWAREHGVAPATITQWKRHPVFKVEWEKRAAELNVSIERTQDVIGAVFKAAVAGDVKAASLYLQYIDKFTPKKAVVVEDRTVQDMSDEELADVLEAQIVDLRSGTRRAS